MIDGSYYAFAENGVLCRDMMFSKWNSNTKESDYYWASSNGACQGIDTSYTGWHLDDSGNWYYIRNGHAVTGTTVIDGVMYEFDGYGVWNLKS